ncbi:hypothetical protein ACQ4PT_049467 [Festuca glaucescens]
MYLENEGGEDARFFGPGSKCTHMIVCSDTVHYDHVWCREARANGSSVVNEIWIHDSLRHGELSDVNKPLFKPKRELGGIQGSQNLTICCEGYCDESFAEIEGLVNLIGARFYPAFTSQATHLLSFNFNGPAYQTARETGVCIVNKRWLSDCANQWIFLPVDINIPSDWALDLEEHQTAIQQYNQFSSDLTWLDGESSESTSCASVCHEFTTPPPMSSSLQIDNTKCHSTGSKTPQGTADIKPNCKKSLETTFDCSGISLQDFGSRRSKLVQFILFPLSLLQGIEMTEPFTKFIILKCFARLAQLKLKKKSLSGKFDASKFIISEVTGTVELHDVVELPASEAALEADKDGFIVMIQRLFDNEVPIDVSIWLKCIAAGWDDDLLCHHINMVQPDKAFGEFQTLFHLLVKAEIFHYWEFNVMLTSTPLQDYVNWVDNHTFIWHPLEKNKNYYDIDRDKQNWYYADAKGLLKNIRDVFEHRGKAYTEWFLGIILGEMPYLLSDLQKALYDLDFLSHLSVKFAG